MPGNQAFTISLCTGSESPFQHKEINIKLSKVFPKLFNLFSWAMYFQFFKISYFEGIFKLKPNII